MFTDLGSLECLEIVVLVMMEFYFWGYREFFVKEIMMFLFVGLVDIFECVWRISRVILGLGRR